MKTIILTLSLILSAAALAGQEGHATGVIRCAGSAQVLDLYEGQQQGLVINESNVVVDLQVYQAFKKLEKINPSFAAEARNMYRIARKARQAVPAGEVLIPPTDSGLKTLPAGCQLEAVAKYYDSFTFWETNYFAILPAYDKDILLIDDVLLSELAKKSATQEAAFWVHEAIYKTYRGFNYGGDSKIARKVTAYLFSTSNTIPSVTSTIPRGVPVLKVTGSTLIGEPDSMEAYVFPVAGKIRIQVVRAGAFAFGPMGVELNSWQDGRTVQSEATWLANYLANPNSYVYLDYIGTNRHFTSNIATYVADGVGVTLLEQNPRNYFGLGWDKKWNAFEPNFKLELCVASLCSEATNVMPEHMGTSSFSIVQF